VSIDDLREQFLDASKRHPYFPAYLSEGDDSQYGDEEPDLPRHLRTSAGEKPAIAIGITREGDVQPLRISIPGTANPEAWALLRDLAIRALPVLRQHGVNPDEPPCATPEGRWLFWVFHVMRCPDVGEWTHAPISETNNVEFKFSTENVFYLSYLTLAQLMTQQPAAGPDLLAFVSPTTDERVLHAIRLLCRDYQMGRRINVSEYAREAGIHVNTLRSRSEFMQVYNALMSKERVATAADVEADAELTPLAKGRLHQKTHVKPDVPRKRRRGELRRRQNRSST
jgi:hypothetical protein